MQLLELEGTAGDRWPFGLLLGSFAQPLCPSVPLTRDDLIANFRTGMSAQAWSCKRPQARGCGRPTTLSPCLPRRIVGQGNKQSVWHKVFARNDVTAVHAAQREISTQASQPPAVAPDVARWDLAYIGRMPMVGLEDVAEALPSTLSGPLALHSFVALGSSSRPNQVCVGGRKGGGFGS